MKAPSSGAAPNLSHEMIDRIEGEVKQATIDHLDARDARTALGDFTEDAVLVSNACWYSTGEWAEVVEEFYGTMREVHVADWEEMRVDVLNPDAAIVTARFHWSSTDISGATIDLRGVWTALFVREGQRWKIHVRHESFGPAGADDDEPSRGRCQNTSPCD